MALDDVNRLSRDRPILTARGTCTRGAPSPPLARIAKLMAPRILFRGVRPNCTGAIALLGPAATRGKGLAEARPGLHKLLARKAV